MTAPHDRSLERRIEGVERAFGELGLPHDRAAGERARERAYETALGDAPAARAEAAETVALSFACRLLADASPSLAGDPALLVQLIERLQDALGVTRAQLARELLARPELALLAPAVTGEALLALVDGGERRLVRLGYDLHDGPLQELLVLADEVRLFREQLGGVLDGRDERAIVLGRVDDVEGRLVALEASVRRISTAAHASALADRPFAESLGEALDAFKARSGIAPSVRLQGDPAALSASQRIALLSVVGEALNNVREHARGARSVAVEIECGADGAGARVVDDGCGFDVERALVSAARRGRMGLAGIHERVRLLGGRCVVDSREGGPTTVTLSLPRWQPSSPSQDAPAPRGARAASSLG